MSGARSRGWHTSSLGFLRHGLMEYGSIFGHGAYLGPDFTADYLHRAALFATRAYGGDNSGVAREKVIADFKTNRYDGSTDTVTYTDVQAKAFNAMVTHYVAYFGPESASKGLLPDAITDRADVKALTAYFAWSAWAGSTLRPDKDYTYTNNWPPEPLVGNSVTADVVVWSVLSLIVLLAGIGVLFAAFGRWGERMGWRGRQADTISFRRPGDVAVTPTQRACAYFFLVVGLLFVVQTMVGAASEHYRADLTSFFGFDLAPLAAVQPGAHLARAAGDLLDRHVVPGHRALPGAHRLRQGAAPSVLARLRAARCAGRRGVRQPDRRAAGHPRVAVAGAARDRDAGLGVPGPGPGLAGAPDARPLLLGLHAVPRPQGSAARTRRGSTCRGCSSSPGSPSPRSTRSVC